MIIEISVALIALSFVFLVIFLILTLRSLKITFDRINTTLIPLQRHTEDLCEQAEALIEQTTHLTKDLNHKLDAFDGVFNSISHVGNRLERSTLNLKSHQDEFHSAPVEDAIEWALLGCQLWQKLKKRR
jgi:uncharacterized protein YoxC